MNMIFFLFCAQAACAIHIRKSPEKNKFRVRKKRKKKCKQNSFEVEKANYFVWRDVFSRERVEKIFLNINFYFFFFFFFVLEIRAQ